MIALIKAERWKSRFNALGSTLCHTGFTSEIAVACLCEPAIFAHSLGEG
jgi:hypothetical protein